MQGLHKILEVCYCYYEHVRCMSSTVIQTNNLHCMVTEQIYITNCILRELLLTENVIGLSDIKYGTYLC